VLVATPCRVRPADAVLLCALVAFGSGCSAAGSSEKNAVKPTYDPKSGRLTELAYDSNHNGTTDTRTEMDGARPLLTRIDKNEDGRVDRWEYYDDHSRLINVGSSRRDDGKPDAWAFIGQDGKPERIEISSTGDQKKIDRWEHYANDTLTTAEEDTNRDGVPDKWETYQSGVLETVSFDENRDGKPDRRLTYVDGVLVAIETDPDGSGAFRKRLPVKPE
jgi:hypothetical protein